MSRMRKFDEISALAYMQLDTRSCIATLFAELNGSLVITACPVNNIPGSIVTISAIATNIGNINNNSFVIGVTITRADDGTIIKSVNSGNIDLIVNMSHEWSTSFTMPTSDVNITFDLQADPLFNY